MNHRLTIEKDIQSLIIMKNKWLICLLILLNALNIFYFILNYFEQSSKEKIMNKIDYLERSSNITTYEIQKINKEILPDLEEKIYMTNDQAFEIISNNFSKSLELFNLLSSKVNINHQAFENFQIKVQNDFKNDINTMKINIENDFIHKSTFSDFEIQNNELTKLRVQSEHKINSKINSLTSEIEKNFTLFHTIDESFRNNVLRYINLLETDASNTKKNMTSQILLIIQDIKEINFLLKPIRKKN